MGIFLFEPIENIAINKIHVLSTDSFQHGVKVQRLRMNDTVTILNGDGLEATAKIITIQKNECKVIITAIVEHERPNSGVHLYIARPKHDSRWEWLLEKCTEMGVLTITPIITERTETKLFKTERFEKVIISALKQSGNVFMPKLHPAIDFLKLITQIKQKNAWIAHCMNDSPKAKLDIIKRNEENHFLIGPEGDFTSNEVALAHQNGIKGINLGHNRLRTETAGIFVAAIGMSYA